MSEELPGTLAPSSAPPRRLLRWCAGVAIVVGIVFLLPRPDKVVAPGEMVESGVAVLLEPESGLEPGSEPVADAVADSAANIATDTGAADTGPGTRTVVPVGGDVLVDTVVPAGAGVPTDRETGTGDVAIGLPATAAAAGGGELATDDEPSLASLFGERPALIAVLPEAFVITVDGRRFEPGDELERGIVLDAIEEGSLRFSQDGRSFSHTGFAVDTASTMD